MRLGRDVLFYFAIFIDEFDGAICKPDGDDVAGTLAEGHPVMVDGIGVEIEPFAGLSCVDVPFVDDIVVSDAE